MSGRADTPAALPPAPPRPGTLPLAQELLPGAVLCGVIALAATFVALVHGGPQLLYALLLGMALHGVGQEGRAAAGIEFCSRFVLRLGVALLGARIAAEQVLALGWPTAALVVAAVLSTMAVGVALARRLGLTLEQGLVSGGATAICGASAALAISAVLPRSREQDRFTLLVVVCVSTLSTLAMLVYPLWTTLLHWSAPQAGLFLGASIHDVAQVMGAAYLLGPVAGDTAVIVKLFRVSLLVAVVAGIGLVMRPRRGAAAAADGERPALLPWFMVVFVALVLLNSMHLLPSSAEPVLSSVSRACLVMAIAALGLKTALRSLAEAGWRPLLLMLAETLWLAAAVGVGVAAMPGWQ
ncbi:putative sulfate exporter family transporter [Variovorax sp. YR752]|uniref:YeiH family protein n=1 Tax=Variovorax sp. YR752 TaxID=1884383 RepID=UPI0031379C2B